jgi:hypothetical protein
MNMQHRATFRKAITFVTCAVALSGVFASVATASAPRHLKVGECSQTQIDAIDGRLEGVPESGSYVSFADGRQQVSYSIVPAIQRSRVGDQVRVCLKSYPKNCPRGDIRGIVYTTHNLRTAETWTQVDSQHLCGGA